MVSEILLDKYPQKTNKEFTPSTQYSFEDHNNHYDEMMNMNIISDGIKWMEEQKLKIKLSGSIDEADEFTVNNIRGIINKYLQKLRDQSDENMKKDIIDRINNANDRLDYPLIYQAAALILVDSQNGSPYSSFLGKENSGVWVKALLGKEHYDHFIKEKENCVKEINLSNNNQSKKQFDDMLASCELDYIINNVLGANNKLKFFGSCEGKDYNPSKQILSEYFADELSKYKLIKSHTEYLK